MEPMEYLLSYYVCMCELAGDMFNCFFPFSPASVTIISVKGVAAMITLSAKGNMQLTYPIFYLMLILMVVTCVFQAK